MAEKLKPQGSFIQRFWESSKPPPGQEGALGPIDTFNRASYRISKPAAIGTGVATLLVPEALPLFIGAGIWAVSDKVQIKGSQMARRKMESGQTKGSAKYAENMTVRNGRVVEQSDHTNKMQLPSSQTLVEFPKRVRNVEAKAA